MQTSMARLTPRFSANRMIRQYTEEYYLPSAAAVKKRTKDKGAVVKQQLTVWSQAIRLHWQNIHFGEARIHHADGTYSFQVPVYLNDLDPGAIQVQVYAEPRNNDTEAVIKPLDRGEKLPGTVNGYQYTGTVPADRPAKNYTPRIIPYHPLVHVPLEENHIMWYG